MLVTKGFTGTSNMNASTALATIAFTTEGGDLNFTTAENADDASGLPSIKEFEVQRTKDWEALIFFGGCLIWLTIFLILFWTDNFWCDCVYNTKAKRRLAASVGGNYQPEKKSSKTSMKANAPNDRKPLINAAATNSKSMDFSTASRRKDNTITNNNSATMSKAAAK